MCNESDTRRECEWADEGALCATHQPTVRIVTIIPEVPHVRMVAAPERVVHTSRFHVSGQPLALRGYRIA